MAARLLATRPDVLWVGLGAPKQEKWMAQHVGKIHATAMIGVGAAFDFHSGNVQWAPSWVRKCGLEWAYRLAVEPRRMFRRNLDSPIFMGKVFSQALRQRTGRALGRIVSGVSRLGHRPADLPAPAGEGLRQASAPAARPGRASFEAALARAASHCRGCVHWTAGQAACGLSPADCLHQAEAMMELQPAM